MEPKSSLDSSASELMVRLQVDTCRSWVVVPRCSISVTVCDGCEVDISLQARTSLAFNFSKLLTFTLTCGCADCKCSLPLRRAADFLGSLLCSSPGPMTNRALLWNKHEQIMTRITARAVGYLPASSERMDPDLRLVPL